MASLARPAPLARKQSFGAQLKKTLRRPQFRFGLAVLLPIAAWYIMFSFRPIAMAFRMAVVDYKLLDPDNSRFVGLYHFKTIFTNYALFFTAVLNTLKYALFINIGMLPAATILAYCLSNVLRGRPLYQWALFVPVVVSMAAIALLFRFLMDPEIGIFNHILRSVGLRGLKWLTDPQTAMVSVVLVDLWKAVGSYIVMLTAGFLAVPEELYDACKVDGANAWHTFWKVTLPLLTYTMTLVIILVTIASLQVYASALILTGGGPGRATYMISQFVVEEAFTNFRFGLATAAAFVLFLVILVISVVQLRLTRVKWQY
jgi:ABC-type sugar transport system permease subunit